MLSVEVGAAFPDDPLKADAAILRAWKDTTSVWLPPELQPPDWSAVQNIGQALRLWAQQSPRPLIIFIDEIDALQDETLISVLRQLRSGYPNRPQGFPQSLALIGVRDVRDYKFAAGSSGRLNTASPFNIKIASLTLRNFDAEDVKKLYEQHTTATGQAFTPEALARAFDLTQGQPWLVNALAKVIVEELAPNSAQDPAQKPAQPITAQDLDQAKEILIRRKDTHLDSLASILLEPRVRAIIEPMLAGRSLGEIPPDDLQFLLDLGLCRMSPQGGLIIANPIYREVLPRVLSRIPEASLPQISPSWLTPTGTLDPDQLLQAFLSFWQQHGEPLLRSAAYHEIAPHLVMMAFLHRVVNGEGTLEREYAIGSGRMDLCLRYREVVLGIELKVWQAGRPDPLTRGLAQLDSYLAGLGQRSGWLVIFDRRPGLPEIGDRTTVERTESPEGRSIVVIRG